MALVVRELKLDPVFDLAKELKSQMALRLRIRILLCRIVVQVLPEPSLDLCHAHPLA